MRPQTQILNKQSVWLPVRPFIPVWILKGLSFLLSTVLLCSYAGAAGTLSETLEGSYDATGEPMRIQVVRSGRVGCEPGYADWISAEGMMVQGTAQRFGIVLNSLRGRKLPVLIHSHGGTVLEAMLIGTLVRARGLDVIVARTDRDSCSNSPSECKAGGRSGDLARIMQRFELRAACGAVFG
jgi:hypothetical protein